MPIPNHCVDCDRPLDNDDGYLCLLCQERQDNIISSNSVGEDLTKILPSLNEVKGNQSTRR